ncbi:ABC transporter permease [Corynebacterium parakroppenstedtii]|uniref:ABC transporter permease n=1 Tax=Corynebacterium parakroppenstedtii TaxID=2828363 RepID=UPI001C8F9F80|nr:ABC transporter permease subunit [Corynebacterium parakroppenstedtii]MBY0795353.1 ABC transporter permease subunit [Corynebacterium parakroppenstedtii]
MNWVITNWEDIAELTGQHLRLALPPIVFSLLIAIPIGRYAFSHPLFGRPLLNAASLMYAVPSLPLIITIPIIIGTPLRSNLTMITALTVYGVALLVRTAADAFASVDARTRDAAVALGHSPHTILWKVDLPLAIPVIASGLRVVASSTIGLVTIGTLVGIPSLGSLLTDGFQRGITAEVTAGIIATIIVALIIDAIIQGLTWLLTPWSHASGGASS